MVMRQVFVSCSVVTITIDRDLDNGLCCTESFHDRDIIYSNSSHKTISHLHLILNTTCKEGVEEGNNYTLLRCYIVVI